VVNVWDADKGKLLYSFPDHTDTVFGLAFYCTDGSSQVGGTYDGLCSGSFDNTIRLYSWEENRHLHTFNDEFTDKVYAVNHSRDGSYLVACSECHGQNIISCWDVATHELCARLVGHAQQVYSCCFHPIKGYAVTASQDKTIKVTAICLHFAQAR